MRELIILLIQYIAKGNTRKDVGTLLFKFYSSVIYAEIMKGKHVINILYNVPLDRYTLL